MRIRADVVGADGQEPDVVIDEVQAQHLQPWMLVSGVGDELFVVDREPDPFVPEEPDVRPRRWVNVPLVDTETQLSTPATDRLLIVYGAALDDLQPMLAEDLYTADEEALARNGMCSERVDEEDAEVPEYCGLPSDPGSFYRLCVGHDHARRVESDDLVARGFAATYGAVAELAG